jgi:hypothetical protein
MPIKIDSLPEGDRLRAVAVVAGRLGTDDLVRAHNTAMRGALRELVDTDSEAWGGPRRLVVFVENELRRPMPSRIESEVLAAFASAYRGALTQIRDIADSLDAETFPHLLPALRSIALAAYDAELVR